MRCIPIYLYSKCCYSINIFSGYSFDYLLIKYNHIVILLQSNYYLLFLYIVRFFLYNIQNVYLCIIYHQLQVQILVESA